MKGRSGGVLIVGVFSIETKTFVFVIKKKSKKPAFAFLVERATWKEGRKT